jgi:GAF domain-containing protein/CheY-like chemotaxis protein
MNVVPGANGNPGASVDIQVRGEAVGNLTVSGISETMLSEDDRALLQSVAERVSLAVENVRLVEQTQTALRESEQLYEATRALSSAPDLEAAYALMVEYLQPFEGLDRVAVLRASPDPVVWPQYLTYAYTWNRGSAGRSNSLADAGRIPSAVIPFERLFPEIRKPSNFVLQEDYLGAVLYSNFKSMDVNSITAVPITTPTHWYGALVCSSLRSTPFPESFVKFASAIADQIAIFIDNRRLFEEAESESRRNRALAEAAQIASQIGGDFEAGIAELFRAVVAPAGYDRWWFGMTSQQDRTAVVQRVTSHFTENSPLYQMARITKQDSNALAEAAELGELVLINTPEEHHLLANLPTDRRTAFGKHLAMPVRIENMVVGVFMLGRGPAESDLDERDVQFATTLANQLVVTIQNQQLFSQAESGRETLQTVIDSLPTGVLVLDADTRHITLTNGLVRSLLGLDETTPYRQIHTSSGQDYLPDEFPPLRVLNSGQPIYAEDMSVMTEEGSKTDLIVNATLIKDSIGKPVSAVAVFQDVTELRELENVLQESLRETTTLYEASRAIAAERDLSAILNVLVGQIMQLISPDVFYAVFRDEGGVFTHVYKTDFSLGINVELVEGPFPLPRSILSEGEPYVEETVRSNPILSANLLLGELGVESLAAFPLNARQRVIGWLVMGFIAQRDFASEERRLLSTLSDQAAVALESARLAETNVQALSETKLLYEATYAINRAVNIEGALEIVRDQVMTFAPTFIDIYLAGPGSDSSRVRWVMHYNAHEPTSGLITLDNEEYFDDRILIDAAPYFINDVSTSTIESLALVKRVPNWEQMTAQASVPLNVKGRATGRLILGFNRPYYFGRFERQFLTTIADQVAIVIDNSALIQQTQESLEEIGTLYESSKGIADAKTYAEILQAIIDHAAQPAITRARLIRLITPYWDSTEASAEISAEWLTQQTSEMLMQRIDPASFMLWNLISSPDQLWISEVASDDRLEESARQTLIAEDIQAMVVVPMAFGGHPVGALVFESGETWIASDKETRVYSSLADQAAITIENRNLLEQANRRARQLQISAEVARAASSILNVQELFDKTVDLIKESFQYDHAQIFLVTEDGTDARLVSSTGEAGKTLLMRKHHLEVGSLSVIGQVTKRGIPQIAADVADIGVVWRPNPILPNTKSEMALPLIVRGQVLGALDVQSNQPGAFTREDQDVLANLANQIAVAIDNARSFAASTQRADEMRFLFDVTSVASTALKESRESYERILEMMLTSTNSDVIALGLRPDPDDSTHADQYLIVRGADGALNRSFVPNMDVRAQPFYEEIRRGNTVYNNDVFNTHPQYKDFGGGIGSIVSLSIRAGDRVLGSFALINRAPNSYDRNIISLLQTLSTSLASVIQNARLLQEVQEANERLREIDKLKSQFLANMSHELRTPLNSIIGFSRVILKGIDGPLTDMQQQDLSTIHESGKHLLNLVNDILDQAKIEAGKMELSYTFFSITDTIKSVMSTAVGLVKDKPVRLHQEIENELPNVYGDEFRSRQVLLNLISNAAKFTAQGSVTVSAFHVEDEGKSMIQISVTDTGIGIPTDKLESVFEAFQQVENSAARQYEGTGLGLPISRALVLMQGGRIWVDSEPGVGSTFSFTIPLEAPVTEEVATESAEAPVQPQLAEQVAEVIAQAEKPQPTKRIVLAVEDEPGMINLYRRYLAKAGYEVVGAKAEEAEELAELYQPRVILLDINMPTRSGWDVLGQLKDRDTTFKIPVIVCSIENERERAFRMGATDYLLKSIDEQTLVDTVKRVELERDRRKILIIDDLPESIRLVHDALSTDDRFIVIEAVGGLQGLDMVTGHWPDLIILDLRMPEMDGFQVFSQLKSNPDTARIPVLVVTADDLSDAERGHLEGAYIYRKQTVDVDELIQNVVAQLSWE